MINYLNPSFTKNNRTHYTTKYVTDQLQGTVVYVNDSNIEDVKAIAYLL